MQLPFRPTHEPNQATLPVSCLPTVRKVNDIINCLCSPCHAPLVTKSVRRLTTGTSTANCILFAKMTHCDRHYIALSEGGGTVTRHHRVAAASRCTWSHANLPLIRSETGWSKFISI
eukprot:3748306-Pleurochrysis_carterae.AAC.1